MPEVKWRGRDILQLGPVIPSLRGDVRGPGGGTLNDRGSHLLPHNVPALAKRTEVFEVVHHEATGPLKVHLKATGKLLLRPTEHDHLLNQNSVHIFLESQH
ncbi:hypothetical protein PAXRUDRAFT_824423 [Paxillus rubicundulus Ve08.2h10]|uniref:Uncharacterized protein n=1 Tax=Paxillus rubicundulus Ve08.2h10 TaxID=930991 RepID=A0A0D0DI03_9AGAM|nr:hypothetical protein PAXRUDRAFT_824423 [Paxillus rubicundulus Ve08.2h10]